MDCVDVGAIAFAIAGKRLQDFTDAVILVALPRDQGVRSDEGHRLQRRPQPLDFFTEVNGHGGSPFAQEDGGGQLMSRWDSQ